MKVTNPSNRPYSNKVSLPKSQKYINKSIMKSDSFVSFTSNNNISKVDRALNQLILNAENNEAFQKVNIEELTINDGKLIRLQNDDSLYVIKKNAKDYKGFHLNFLTGKKYTGDIKYQHSLEVTKENGKSFVKKITPEQFNNTYNKVRDIELKDALKSLDLPNNLNDTYKHLGLEILNGNIDFRTDESGKFEESNIIYKELSITLPNGKIDIKKCNDNDLQKSYCKLHISKKKKDSYFVLDLIAEKNNTINNLFKAVDIAQKSQRKQALIKEINVLNHEIKPGKKQLENFFTA